MAITATNYVTAALPGFTRSSIKSSPNPHIQNIALNTLGLLITAFSLLAPAAATSSTLTTNPNCLTHNCPDLKEDKLHCWERSAISADPKNKLLFLSAGHDPFGLANPKINDPFLSSLDDKFDFQYSLISSYEEMCKEIDDASKIGNLAHVIIEGQGILSLNQTTSEGLIFLRDEASNPVSEKRFTLKNKDINSCFSGLDPSGSIILLSDFAGAPRQDFQQSFAQKLSDVIHRVVVASVSISPQIREIASFDPFQMFTPSENDAKQNNFREFRPL